MYFQEFDLLFTKVIPMPLTTNMSIIVLFRVEDLVIAILASLGNELRLVQVGGRLLVNFVVRIRR